MTVNVLTHVLIFLTVLICILFSCNSTVGLYELHIILCVLGYQFFMCQGTLIMSQYNSWSMYISRRYKKHIHWSMQVLAAILVTIGTAFIIQMKSVHFTSIHGKLGLAALVCCLASLLNGLLAMYPRKLSSCISVFWIRFFHYVTGIASLFLATGSLCAAFEYRSFKVWTGNEDVFVPTITAFTWIFTILVTLDFWIMTGNRIRKLV
ncbi:hypothetical protein PYW07_005820 [Mythimna separata]|uniref:ascorbate ferrireductase (transmembrane) n=1 Tax=Mythimna separata TaxID=271217 RepID=A0AAD7YK83_MYTSE|nr:hypothetical protein PYW07_005820 [Mythimna separata]